MDVAAVGGGWRAAGGGRRWLDRNNEEVRADRDYHEAPKPSGCVAMELRANLLERAALHFDGGWYRLGGKSKDGTAKQGIRLVDIMKNDADHRRRGLVPEMLEKYPCLELLPKKICHFFNDYFHDKFPSLNLDVSNGQHNELMPEDIQNLLERLRPNYTQTGPAEIQVFNCYSLGSKDRRGTQKIRCRPLQKFYAYHRQVHDPHDVCTKCNVHSESLATQY